MTTNACTIDAAAAKVADASPHPAANRRRVRAGTPAVEQDASRPLTGQWCVGTVTGRGEDCRMHIHSGGLHLRATRAASCLLEPAIGDSVACLRVAPDEAWVLAVLMREGTQPQVLRCHGDTRLEVQGGELSLHADRVALDAHAFDARTHTTTLSTDSADVAGRELTVAASRIRLVGSLLSTVMDRVQHFSKTYLRRTEGLDRVSAVHADVQADELLKLEGNHALVNGRELVKTRGAQIHFG